MISRIIYITFWMIGTTVLWGQNDVSTVPEIPQDTTTQDTIYTKRNTFKEIFSGKPGRAAFYSLIIPGGGQIYNKKWLKLPLTYVVEGGAATWLIINNSFYQEYDGIFNSFVANNGVDPNLSDNIRTQQQAKSIRDSYRKTTEYAWVFLGLAHLYNVFDAYVDRHLMDFDISEDLTIEIFPSPTPYGYAAIGIGYKF